MKHQTINADPRPYLGVTDLTNVAKKWPMLRVTFGVIVTFCCAVPLVWLFSNLFVDGVRTFGH